MKISTRGRYAIRFLLDIGEREENGFITLKEIAERQDISRKYLEQIVPILNQAGLLKANRGYKGGYRLGRPAQEITVAEVLRATEGSLVSNPCQEKPSGDCVRMANCPSTKLWQGLEKVVNDYLEGITLADLIKDRKEMTFDDYSI